MSTSSIKVTSDQAIERAKKLLSEVPGGVETALMRSINRAAQAGKTQAVKEVRARYTVKAADVRQTLTTSKATRAKLEAEIVSRGPMLGLAAYKHSPKTDSTGANQKRVRVSVKRDGGMKPLGQAFVWHGKIMQRVGKKRLPIEKKLGPSIPSIIGNQEVVEAIEERTEEMIVKRLDHEVNRILKV